MKAAIDLWHREYLDAVKAGRTMKLSASKFLNRFSIPRTKFYAHEAAVSHFKTAIECFKRDDEAANRSSKSSISYLMRENARLRKHIKALEIQMHMRSLDDIEERFGPSFRKHREFALVIRELESQIAELRKIMENQAGTMRYQAAQLQLKDAKRFER